MLKSNVVEKTNLMDNVLIDKDDGKAMGEILELLDNAQMPSNLDYLYTLYDLLSNRHRDNFSVALGFYIIGISHGNKPDK